MQFLNSTFLFSLFSSVSFANSTSSANYFNLTAIAARDGKSLFQCWQLTDPLTVSTTKGIVGAAIQQLGDLGSGQYGWLPANYPGTPHPAPVPQYVILLSGMVKISIPESDETHIFPGGTHGIVFADDTVNKTKNGHISTILDQPAEILTIPTANGTAPPHRILYDGVCRPNELNL